MKLEVNIVVRNKLCLYVDITLIMCFFLITQGLISTDSSRRKPNFFTSIDVSPEADLRDSTL